MAPLSKKQKAILCIKAREAWALLPAHARSVLDFDEWRKLQQHQACGKDSLRWATQKDYSRLLAHWQQMLRQDGAAFDTLMRGESNGRRVALYKLRQACAKRGLMYPAYPQKICGVQYGTTISEASEQQLWQLIYTVNNRTAKTKHQAPSTKN